MLEKQRDLDDALYAILANANTLAESVIKHVDDWSEGRAYAYAVRASLQRYRDAKLHLPENNHAKT